ncbi:MAG: oligosaccharide flippase family protein [Candidatus Woesebacteria bacterium]|nr:oligosaccharide flippase family protein [Candidatus Woesebacteria bacterium]
MKKYIDKAKLLVFSSTAKDTYILFGGNVLSAFLGFVYTLIIARALSIYDFGIFSAAVNLVIILTSITDLGISTGAVSFVAEADAGGKKELSKEYIKASSVIRLIVTFAVSLLVIIFSKFVSVKFLATDDPMVAILTGVVTLSLALPMLVPFILQAKKKFLNSIIADNLLYLSRLGFAFVFMFLARLTIGNSLISFVLGGIVGTIVGIILIKPDFLKSKPTRETYKKLIKYSGWIGVNRIISSISGRLDIQMLAVMTGAVATGLYSIPNRLAGFVIVLTSSFSGVLAPRLASFNNKDQERKYIIKATLALIPIIAGLILWVVIAKPFIVILFGDKYLSAVPIFQALTISMIPFVFTAPSVTAIVYAMKKTVYIGAFSFFQLAAIFLLNLYFIPKYGPIGPTVTYGITNTILAIYTWVIVIKHYWPKKNLSII